MDMMLSEKLVEIHQNLTSLLRLFPGRRDNAHVVMRHSRRFVTGGSTDGPTLRRRVASLTKKTGMLGPCDGCQYLGSLAGISADLNYLTVQVDRMLDGLFSEGCRRRS